jgi:hypothetical protein
MIQLIACCGLDCESCDARIATINDNNQLREATARKWSAMNNAPEITSDTINCMGCRTEGAKFIYCSNYCAIRRCVQDKGVATCGDCAEMETCPIVGSIFMHNHNAKGNLQHIANI